LRKRPVLVLFASGFLRFEINFKSLHLLLTVGKPQRNWEGAGVSLPTCIR
jgi:hypothetical protein